VAALSPTPHHMWRKLLGEVALAQGELSPPSQAINERALLIVEEEEIL